MLSPGGLLLTHTHFFPVRMVALFACWLACLFSVFVCSFFFACFLVGALLTCNLRMLRRRIGIFNAIDQDSE